MNRRKFLERLGIGTVAAVAAPMVIAEVLKPEDNHVFDHNRLNKQLKNVENSWNKGITQKNYISVFDYGGRWETLENAKLREEFYNNFDRNFFFGLKGAE